MKPIFAANWKMNLSLEEGVSFANSFSQAGKNYATLATLIIAPQTVFLEPLKSKIKGCGVFLCAQNSGPDLEGAYTGEISPAALKELGCDFVLIGHSERRHVFKESESLLEKRLKAALSQNLKVIYCVGELLEERKKGITSQVVEAQLAPLKLLKSSDLEKVLVAYEPVWAIGTGETASPAQAEEVHQVIRKWLSFSSKEVPILYGGSVKPENAKELMAKPMVDGLLIGGASLKANQFAEIIKNGLESKS